MRVSTYSGILTAITDTEGGKTFEIAEEVNPIQFQKIVERLESNPHILLIDYNPESPTRIITVEWLGT